jgi:hypothetical protein
LVSTVRRTLISLCVLVLAGCPSEPNVLVCQSSSTPELLPLLIEGTASTLELISPLGFCEIPLSARRVTVEVFDEQSNPLQVPQPTLEVAKNDGLTHARVAIDLPAGTYQVRAVFEPSLGVLSQQLVVAADLRSAGTVVQVPAECTSGPFQVGAHVVCATSTQLLAREGATWRPVADFATTGTDLVVADDVVWTASRTSVVERYVFSDAGAFTRTHVGTDPGFSFGEVRRDVAIRTDLLRAEADGGLSHQSLADLGESQSLLYEGDAGFRLISPPSICVPKTGACRLVTEGDIWGISQTAVIAQRPLSGFSFDAGFGVFGVALAVIPRPVGPSTGARLVSIGSSLFFDAHRQAGHALTATWGSNVVAATVRDGVLRFFVLGSGAVRAEQAEVVTLQQTETEARVIPLK